MSQFLYSDLLDYKPEIGDNTNRIYIRNRTMYRLLNNRPVIRKTVVIAEEEGTSNFEPSYSVAYSLNKNNRWNVLSKPWLLRDDANDLDFRVVEHAMTSKSRFLGINTDVSKVYIETSDEETFLAPRGNTTTLNNLTELPREKKTRKRKCCCFVEPEHILPTPTSDYVQYDVYKVHSNPAILRDRKLKGKKINHSKSRKSLKDEIEEELMSYYDESVEYDFNPPCYENFGRQSSTSVPKVLASASHHSSLAPKGIKKELAYANELANIKQAVTQHIHNNYFVRCEEPCVEVNAGHISPWLDYPWHKSTNKYVPQNAYKDLLPLWNYQLYYAKRNQEEVECMQKSVEGYMKRMCKSSWKYGKLLFSKDEIEIIRHYQYNMTFLVRILPRKFAPKQLKNKTITNKEIITRNDCTNNRYYDYHKRFANFYRFDSFVIEEDWRLSKLDEQLEPIAKYLEINRPAYNREDEVNVLAIVKSELIKAIEKTVHLFPVAVSITSCTTDHFIDIVVRKNWRQRNQQVVYNRRFRMNQYIYKPYPFAITLTILLDKNCIC